jgi:F-type H+-transporting ATPase subunit alpha
LPIAEIEAGNLSAYIPTNLISISDGQIVTSQSLFAANQRPAIDIGLSVSRVGGKAQWGTMKSVAGRLRLDYAQYLEMKMFSRFGGFGDEAMASRMKRGERIAALLAQPRLAPLDLMTQVTLLNALSEGILDNVDLKNVSALKARLPSLLATDSKLSEADVKTNKLDEAKKSALLEAVHTALNQS